MKLYRVLTAGILVAGMSTQAQALNVIDQNQPTVNTGLFSVLDQVQTTVQSFQQTSDNISGAGIKLHSTTASSTANLSISLMTALPGTSGVQTLASASALANTSINGWFDVYWNSPVATTVNTTYYLVFGSDDQNSALLGSITNPYALGEHFHDRGGVGLGRFGANGTDPFNKGLYDTTFRTYTSVVPVPAAIWLFGTGLLGFVGMRKRNSVVSV